MAESVTSSFNDLPDPNESQNEFTGNQRSSFHQYFIELKVLMKKNVLMLYGSWKFSLATLLIPILLMLLLFALQEAIRPDDNLNPSTRDIISIPKCRSSKSVCHTILWTIGNGSSPDFFQPQEPFENYFPESEIETIMRNVAEKNDLPYGGLNVDGAVTRFPGNESEFFQYTIDNQNITQIGIVWYSENATQFSFNERTISFLIAYNGSTTDSDYSKAIPRIVISVYNALNNEILQFLNNQSYSTPLDHKVRIRDYPSLAGNSDTGIGGLLFFIAILSNFILFLYTIMLEKELQLRSGMKMMGVSDLMYWTHWFIWQTFMLAIFVLLMVITGIICNIGYFSKSAFGASFLPLFLFGLTLIPIAFCLLMSLSSTKQAINAGMLIFVVGIIAQIIFSVPFILDILYDKKLTPPELVTFFTFYPPFNLAKINYEISLKANQDAVSRNDPGFRWSDMYEKRDLIQYKVPAPIDSVYHLIMNFFVFSFLALLLYFFLPSEQNLIAKIFSDKESKKYVDPNIDSDVKLEEDFVHSEKSHKVAIRIEDLWKRFRKNACFNSEKDMIAVKSICLSIREGQVFALLGHNGAGKTTTINMLTGLFPPTSGDAYVYGYSIKHKIREVQKMIGVCPQHNILWPDLTARQHVDLFAELKGISGQERKKMVEDRLNDVLLLKVANHKSKTFSGGMKRRLSVAIASAGNPKVIFMDEPTTGLDPMSRREIWAAIQRLKKGRVIILTTHSMEEADILGDRLGIMAHGRLKCLGTSLHLKNKFGAGYRLNFTVRDESRIEEFRSLIKEKLPESAEIASTSTSFVYSLPTKAIDSLSPFFEWVEASMGDDFIIREWGVSQTTLEEVFLSVGEK